MELIFNELSLQPYVGDIHKANLLVENLIKTYAEAKHQGFKKIRFHQVFEEIVLLKDYTFSDWINDTKKRTLKDLLLAAKVYPFIKDEDERAENEYLKHRYFLENEFIEKREVQGLAAAIIYETLALSMAAHECWKQPELTVLITTENQEDAANKNVNNVWEEKAFELPSIKDFIGSITTPVLIPTKILPSNKKIRLRDDHGKDKLKAFGKRLVQCEYIVSIINSLPFNSNASNLIRRTYSDGRIEIVLFWEDKGYGLVVQTTGRNRHETDKIAEILNEKYAS